MSPGGRLTFADIFIGIIQKDGEQYKFIVLVGDSTQKNNLRSRSVSCKLGHVSWVDKVSEIPKVGRSAWIQCTFI